MSTYRIDLWHGMKFGAYGWCYKCKGMVPVMRFQKPAVRFKTVMKSMLAKTELPMEAELRCGHTVEYDSLHVHHMN